MKKAQMEILNLTLKELRKLHNKTQKENSEEEDKVENDEEVDPREQMNKILTMAVDHLSRCL